MRVCEMRQNCMLRAGDIPGTNSDPLTSLLTVDVISVRSLELFADEGCDEERGEAVGADDEAVHRRPEPGLLRYPGLVTQ